MWKMQIKSTNIFSIYLFYAYPGTKAIQEIAGCNWESLRLKMQLNSHDDIIIWGYEHLLKGKFEMLISFYFIIMSVYITPSQNF